jgi:uncharacterized protein (TIGR03083 family)
LAGDSAATPPPELGDRVIATAQNQRAAGAPTGPWAAKDITPLEAARRAADRYCRLLAELSPDQWLAPCPPYAGWKVRDLVAHLIAVERQFATEIGIDALEPLWANGITDHVAFTLPVVAELASLSIDDLRDRGINTAQRLFEALGALEGTEAWRRRVTLVGAPTTSVNTALVVGTFELWTHTEDIGRATGRVVEGLDPDQLRLLCDLAVHIIPVGVLMMGRSPRPAQVRIVLTGPGGGAWTTALGSEPGEMEALLVADAQSFCRVAAQRLTPAQLAPSVTGDASLVDDVLAGVAVFAA